MKASIVAAPFAVLFVAMLSGCSTDEKPPEALRPVHLVELKYENAREMSRYFGSVQARHEADEAFRVGGKVISRRVEVGQTVREGDLLAVLDDVDYRLAEEAARQQLQASIARAKQAESDWNRMKDLEADGSVSASDEEHARSTLATSRAAAEADTRRLELARNQVKYTVLRASRGGVVTGQSIEEGQVVAAGQPVIAIANESEPEIVMDVPEAHLTAFKNASYTAWLANDPEKKFEVVLRELSAQAAAQTRTYRARLKPVSPRALPLGATATLVTRRELGGAKFAVIPATAITQIQGRPAVWTASRTSDQSIGTVKLAPVVIHGYRNEEVLVSGLPDGTLVVTAGVQKMAPGLRVAMPKLATTAFASRSTP